MEFKQNKFLPPEKQIVTSNPDINVVSSLNAALA
jgi:protein phosphatase 1G